MAECSYIFIYLAELPLGPLGHDFGGPGDLILGDVLWEPNSEASGSHGGEVITPKTPRPLASFKIDIYGYRRFETKPDIKERNNESGILAVSWETESEII